MRHSEGAETRATEQPADPAAALRLFVRVCDAVNAAHLRGIVHRDLKPSNNLVGPDGQPHVADFGLAHPGFTAAAASADGEADPADLTRPLTITGQFLGSLPRASPEQAEGVAGRIDARSDVYSLGVILYRLLTGGRFPYAVAGSTRDVLHNILTAAPTRRTGRRPLFSTPPPGPGDDPRRGRGSRHRRPPSGPRRARGRPGMKGGWPSAPPENLL